MMPLKCHLSRTWYTQWYCAMLARPHIFGIGRNVSQYVSSLESNLKRNYYPYACHWSQQLLPSYLHCWWQVSSGHSCLASQCFQEQGGASWNPGEQFPTRDCNDPASSPDTSVGAGMLGQSRRRAQLVSLMVSLAGCCRAPATA